MTVFKFAGLEVAGHLLDDVLREIEHVPGDFLCLNSPATLHPKNLIIESNYPDNLSNWSLRELFFRFRALVNQTADQNGGASAEPGARRQCQTTLADREPA